MRASELRRNCSKQRQPWVRSCYAWQLAMHPAMGKQQIITPACIIIAISTDSARGALCVCSSQAEEWVSEWCVCQSKYSLTGSLQPAHARTRSKIICDGQPGISAWYRQRCTQPVIYPPICICSIWVHPLSSGCLARRLIALYQPAFCQACK